MARPLSTSRPISVTRPPTDYTNQKNCSFIDSEILLGYTCFLKQNIGRSYKK